MRPLEWEHWESEMNSRVDDTRERYASEIEDMKREDLSRRDETDRLESHWLFERGLIDSMTLVAEGG